MKDNSILTVKPEDNNQLAMIYNLASLIRDINKNESMNEYDYQAYKGNHHFMMEYLLVVCLWVIAVTATIIDTIWLVISLKNHQVSVVSVVIFMVLVMIAVITTGWYLAQLQRIHMYDSEAENRNNQNSCLKLDLNILKEIIQNKHQIIQIKTEESDDYDNQKSETYTMYRWVIAPLSMTADKLQAYHTIILADDTPLILFGGDNQFVSGYVSLLPKSECDTQVYRWGDDTQFSLISADQLLDIINNYQDKDIYHVCIKSTVGNPFKLFQWMEKMAVSDARNSMWALHERYQYLKSKRIEEREKRKSKK